MFRAFVLFLGYFIVLTGAETAKIAESEVVRELGKMTADVGDDLAFLAGLAWRFLSLEWRFALAYAAGRLSVILSVLLIIMIALTLLSKLLAAP